MDNAQVTSQMAQINTVTGIDKLNTTVQGLSSQFMQLQAVQGASLVGHDVIVPGNQVDIEKTRLEGRVSDFVYLSHGIPECREDVPIRLRYRRARGPQGKIRNRILFQEH